MTTTDSSNSENEKIGNVEPGFDELNKNDGAETSQPDPVPEKQKPQKKRKRGRPRKNKPAEPAIDPQLEQGMQLLAAKGSEFAAALPFIGLAWILKDKKYLLTPEERKELAPLCEDVLNKYLPEYVKENAPEYYLGFAILLIVMKKQQDDSIPYVEIPGNGQHQEETTQESQ